METHRAEPNIQDFSFLGNFADSQKEVAKKLIRDF